jgi:hypothetical protein
MTTSKEISSGKSYSVVPGRPVQGQLAMSKYCRYPSIITHIHKIHDYSTIYLRL